MAKKSFGLSAEGGEPLGSNDGNSPPEESFAGWFRGVLSMEGLSHDAAAARIGVSTKTISRWARGETEPRFRELRQLYRALGHAPPLAD